MKHKGRLTKVDPVTGGIDPHQAWIVNNMMLMTDDNWETSRTGIGQFTVEDKEFYGIIAEAIFAGYIEGSQIVGSDIIGESTIRIGDMGNGKWAFEVDKYGNVSMLGGDVTFNVTDKDGNHTDENGNSNIGSSIQDQIDGINGKIEDIEDMANANMYRVEIVADGPTVISTSEDKTTLICKVYSWDSDITDTLNASIFNWRRTSNNVEFDEIWNAMPEHQGVKSIVVDADDIIENSSFVCEVNLPE